MTATLSALELWLDQLGFWTAGQGLLGMALFALASGLSVVFFLPGSILMTASGAAFGLTRGFLTAQAGATLGAGLAFLVSRYVARRRVAGWVSSKPAFAAVDEAIGSEGWKIVILTRCCPLFPYIFQNYAYGLTRVSFAQYAAGSFIGLVPATLVFSYLGSLGRSGIEAASGTTSALDLFVRGFGLIATIAVSVYLTRLSRRALEKVGV
ncbi:MAG: TVP38/TMEM64 family protein [Vicinamibacteria bacterium]